MKIISYFHPIRTFLPCTGVGRHVNNVLAQLYLNPEVDLSLLVSKQWLGPDGKLPENCPVREMPTLSFPQKENALERRWKLLHSPDMDAFLPQGTDWMYAPVETYFPVKTTRVAITIHDIQAFETNLPWSNTWSHRLFRLKWSTWIYHTLRKSNLIFTVSEFSKRRMVELLKADEKKIIVTGNAVDEVFLNQFNPHPSGSDYFLIIGGLRYKKGADYVLKVASELRKRNKEIRIVVTGDSEDNYALIARQYPNIELTGRVSDEELTNKLSKAGGLLFLTYYEGFGIPILEAMALGVPVIASNNSSLPEIAGDAAILVNPSLHEEIAEHMIALLVDNKLRQQCVSKGKVRVANYSWKKCADIVYKSLNEY